MSRASVGIAVGLYTTVASASGAATRVRAAVLCGSLRWAAGRGRALGLETTTSGRFRSGDALCWAVTGKEHSGSTRDVRMVDASQDERRFAV